MDTSESDMALEKYSLILVVVYLVVIFNVPVRTQTQDTTDIVGDSSNIDKTMTPETTTSPGTPRIPPYNELEEDMDQLITAKREEELIEQAIAKFEHDVETKDINGESNYLEMIKSVNAITDLLESANDVNIFVDHKGIQRVIVPFVHTSNNDLKTEFLILIKKMFDLAPPVTSQTIEENNIHNFIFDVFQNGKSNMKSHILDILYMWLPRNPQAQDTVLNKIGLAQFYALLLSDLDLDSETSRTLLDIFNKVLVEHIGVIKNPKEKSLEDLMNLELYENARLIEQISCPRGCNAVLSVFSKVLIKHEDIERDIFKPVFELMKNVKPLCLEHFKGYLKALDVFEEYLELVNEMKDDVMSVDMSDILSLLQEYIDVIKPTAQVHRPTKIVKDDL